MEDVSGSETPGCNQDHERALEHPVLSLTGGPVGAWTFTAHRVAIKIEKAIYSIDAVLRAGYKFTDRAFVFLTMDDQAPGFLIAALAAKDAKSDLEHLAGEFVNELLDLQRRERVEARFGALRTLVVAQAFSEGNLLDTNQDADYRLDPLGIGRPR